MAKEGACSNDFPTQEVELRCLLVVSDYARGLSFYHDVLGATVIHELAGSQILLVAPSDKPAATDPSPSTHPGVITELSIQVPDCLAAYALLRSRGAEFITPPFDWREETRAFFLDPDGHLLEIREVREA
jgi:catechol 2,3-dioxygenase-like lactoylglutathione lyase family enzyme